MGPGGLANALRTVPVVRSSWATVMEVAPDALHINLTNPSGIVVAALARYNPFAVVLVAFLLGGLQNAGISLQGPDFPSGLVGVMEGMILFTTLGGELFVRYRVRIGRRHHGPQTGAAAAASAEAPR